MKEQCDGLKCYQWHLWPEVVDPVSTRGYIFPKHPLSSSVNWWDFDLFIFIKWSNAIHYIQRSMLMFCRITRDHNSDQVTVLIVVLPSCCCCCRCSRKRLFFLKSYSFQSPLNYYFLFEELVICNSYMITHLTLQSVKQCWNVLK